MLFACAYFLAARVAVNTCASPAGCCAGHAPVATGAFSDYASSPAQQGWSTLTISTTASWPEPQQAEAAGFLEGHITQAAAFDFISNVHGAASPWSPALKQYVDANRAYTDRMVAAHPGDPFWRHVGLVFAQQRAAFAGYAAAAPPAQRLSEDAYYAATLIGDMDDLCVVFGCTRTTSWRQQRARNASGFDPADPTIRKERYMGEGHCSALVRPLGALGAPSEVLFGHTTWSPLEAMNRVYKTYDFPWTLGGTPGSAPAPGRAISFSSYPGVLYSWDDFYTALPSQLAVLETTIINNNATLWALVTPTAGVSDWARNMVANRLADDGASWAAYFGRENSGTYNNMFLVCDFARVQRAVEGGAPLPAGTLTVLEQMPGQVVVTDASRHLAPGGAGYYASYNRIQTPWLFEATNQSALVREFGAHYSYEAYSRALLFAAHAPNVTGEAGFRALMRRNAFQTDAAGAQGCAGAARSGSNAIAERGDLSPATGCIPQLLLQDEAGYDTKYTSGELVRRGQAWAQQGPSHDGQAPFAWSSSPFAHIPHAGQPDKFEFDWVLMGGN